MEGVKKYMYVVHHIDRTEIDLIDPRTDITLNVINLIRTQNLHKKFLPLRVELPL